MSLYKQWEELASKQRSQADYEEFWKNYFEKEKENYQQILASKVNKYEGSVKDLATRFNMDVTTFVGFLDGINSSLEKEIDLEEVTEDSIVTLNINWEKLYFNMLDAKAEWLYTLEEWETILSAEKRAEISKDYRVSQIAISTKIGRNDPCSCGSGKKFKKCCGAN